MTSVVKDHALQAFRIRHDGKDTFVPDGKYDVALGFGRRLHDGSGQPAGNELVNGGSKTVQQFMDLLTGYLVDPDYAHVAELDDHTLRVITPDGSCFLIRIERQGIWSGEPT